MSGMQTVRYGTEDFTRALERLADRGSADLESVEPAVREILDAVRTRGDAAVTEYVRQFEKRVVQQLVRRDYGGAAALDQLDAGLRVAMEEAAGRIRAYHERQVAALGAFEFEEGEVLLGSRVTALERVGIYVPGGKASYPSSVLMSAIPARAAGVREIIVATPNATPAVLGACHLAGVDTILDAGGAQAIGALAYGTASVPRVDKIVGPGNLYVAAAKRLVFGRVDIDSIAGPSEILVLADSTAKPAWVAADLLSQAEHDEAAYPLLCTTSEALATAVEEALASQLADLPREAIAKRSLEQNGYTLLVPDTDTLIRTANTLAAEHVAVHMGDARSVANRVERAGALFVGDWTPEAAGDYFAGPSHVLPTGGAARFAAPLGAYDFVSRSSIIGYSAASISSQAEKIARFARSEGLEAHARAVEIRVTKADSRA